MRKTVDPLHISQEIPLYDLEAVSGLRELFSSDEPQRILDTIKIPNLPKCDGAISVTGDSMYQLLKSEDIILYKETEFENIFFGEMYLLSVKLNDWEEYITVKYV
ncbi:S24 family peptidase [Flavobacterium johnsoniae]|uniref:S24 family peptidase n=1 Tax=Flavobacterium johnsoniae TaxID=986 RepID=UPI0025B17BE4|nr:S24 family peptidase [Flavobacterium johnsoniae]WJS96768.1 S24 family peptidase [Flavobacterium johnsoniae]